MGNIRRTANTAIFFLLLVGCALLSFNASANNGVTENQPAVEVLLLAQAGSCSGKCESAKKRCMAQYTVTNSFGVKMVTPDGAKRCWAAFHQCKSYCK